MRLRAEEMTTTTEISAIEKTLQIMGIDGDKVTNEFAEWLHTRVLADAIDVMNQRSNLPAKADALSWIISDDTCEFSFAACAERLNIEVAILRKKILSMPAVRAAMNAVREWLATEEGRQAERKLAAEQAQQIRLIELAKAGKLERHDDIKDAKEDHVKTTEEVETIAAEAAAAADALAPLAVAVESAEALVKEAADPVVAEAATLVLRDAVRKYNDAGATIWDKLSALLPDVAKQLWYPFIDLDQPLSRLAVWQAVDDLRALALGPPGEGKQTPSNNPKMENWRR